MLLDATDQDAVAHCVAAPRNSLQIQHSNETEIQVLKEAGRR